MAFNHQFLFPIARVNSTSHFLQHHIVFQTSQMVYTRGILSLLQRGSEAYKASDVLFLVFVFLLRVLVLIILPSNERNKSEINKANTTSFDLNHKLQA
jgi:hypothetical protein